MSNFLLLPLEPLCGVKGQKFKDHNNIGCVLSYANSTIGLPMPFGVQPFVTLAYHLYHWLPTGFTLVSIFCRCSRTWVKRFTRENYVIKMEDLINFPNPNDY